MKVLKWFGIVLGALIILVAAFVLVMVAVASGRMNKVYDPTVEQVAIPSVEAAVERGRYLATSVSTCTGCHGPDLGGSFFFDDPAIGQIYSANLTAGEGGKGADYTDEDWVRALRYGVKPDGKPVLVMPSQHFRHLSDEDLGALIAYLKSVPLVDRDSPAPNLTVMGKVLFGLNQLGKLPAEIIAEEGPLPPTPERGVTVEYGQLIARVGACQDCHGEALTGGTVGPGGPVAPNLTPGGQLLVWTEADFIKAFRTGETPQGQLNPELMPFKEYQMEDDDLKALYLYLKSLPAAQQDN
jgi:mono/diheme cytochrome c family protein